MKKTMLALMATVGLAFGAKADVLNSTGFESYSGDFDYTFNDSGDPSAPGYSGDPSAPHYWAVTNSSADLSQTVLTAYGESATPVKVPDAFTNAANSAYLKVDTGADVLYRSVGTLDSVAALNAGTEIGDGLYFDANVQFTASDGEPTYDSADKLVVWLRATEGENPTTNLVVTAAASADEYGVPQGITDFVVSNVAVDADTWYRLTVKAAVDASDHTYFNIYVDNNQVVATDRTDFYSMVNSNTTEGQKITAVGFQGTGAIDNLVWTKKDPFPPEGAYTLALTGADFASSVTVDGNPVSDITSISEDFVVSKTSVAVVVNVGTEDGTFAATTENAGVVISTPARSTEEVQEDEELVTYYLYSFTVTIAEPAADATYSVALAFEPAGGGEEVPESAEVVADGGKVTVQAATEKDAVDAVTVKGVNGTVYADSQKYYTKVATPNGDNWDVTVTLNKTALEADVDTAVAEALEDVGAAEVTLPAGFYYMVESGTDVSISTKAYGTSTGAAIGITGLGKDAGFFKVSVDTTSFEE